MDNKIPKDKFLSDLINQIISNYFQLEKNDKLLLSFFKGYEEFFAKEIQKNKQNSSYIFYDIQIPFKIFLDDFIKKNPAFNDPKYIDLTTRFLRAFVAELCKEADDRTKEDIITISNEILPPVIFVEGNSDHSIFLKENLNYINGLKPKIKVETQYIIWQKEDLDLVVDAMQIRSITNTESKLRNFFHGENETFHISLTKLKQFALIVSKLHEIRAFKMNHGRFNYAFFERHIKDFPYRPKTNYFKNEVCKLLKEKATQNTILKEVNNILKEAKISELYN